LLFAALAGPAVQSANVANTTMVRFMASSVESLPDKTRTHRQSWPRREKANCGSARGNLYGLAGPAQGSRKASARFVDMHAQRKFDSDQNETRGGCTTGATLQEDVAEVTAELLLEAAEARQLAGSLTDKKSIADLLNYASELERDAAKWERRLRWWRLLREQLA
jgi:hypothetical protein